MDLAWYTNALLTHTYSQLAKKLNITPSTLAGRIYRLRYDKYSKRIKAADRLHAHIQTHGPLTRIEIQRAGWSSEPLYRLKKEGRVVAERIPHVWNSPAVEGQSRVHYYAVTPAKTSTTDGAQASPQP